MQWVSTLNLYWPDCEWKSQKRGQRLQKIGASNRHWSTQPTKVQNGQSHEDSMKQVEQQIITIPINKLNLFPPIYTKMAYMAWNRITKARQTMTNCALGICHHWLDFSRTSECLDIFSFCSSWRDFSLSATNQYVVYICHQRQFSLAQYKELLGFVKYSTLIVLYILGHKWFDNSLHPSEGLFRWPEPNQFQAIFSSWSKPVAILANGFQDLYSWNPRRKTWLNVSKTNHIYPLQQIKSFE